METKIKRNTTLILLVICMLPSFLKAQKISTAVKSLAEQQQEFVDLRFGMFIHFNMPTYANQDWPDPEMPASAFNPTKL
jgi:alpha-L-fucosidase